MTPFQGNGAPPVVYPWGVAPGCIISSLSGSSLRVQARHCELRVKTKDGYLPISGKAGSRSGSAFSPEISI
jgi:hypothetical protein